MPLKKGKSRKVISSNIKEMVKSFKSTGKIGKTKPGSIKKAIKIASAAAYTSARKSGLKNKRGKK